MTASLVDSEMMAPLVRVQAFIGMIVETIGRADYRNFQLPFCFPEKVQENFRRFLKSLLFGRNMPVQEVSLSEASDTALQRAGTGG